MDELNESTKVARLFWEVMRLFKQNVAKVFEETDGITAPQMMVMGILSKEKTLKITELSGRLSLPNSTVSGIVDRLEKLGMVERQRSEEDRRVVHVSVSPNFSKMHKSYHEQLEKAIAKTMNQGTAEELDKISQGLDILKKLLGERQE